MLFEGDAPLATRILLIQLRRIGDVLMTTPTIRQLKHAWPEAELCFLTEKPSDQVLQHNPHLQQVWTIPRKPSLPELWRCIQQVRQQQFDIVIDFFGNAQSALLCRLSGAPQRVGFAFQGRRLLYTDTISLQNGPVPYSTTHKLRLLEPLGIAATQDWLPEFPIADTDRDFARQLLGRWDVSPAAPVVSMSPVSRQPYKRWPLQNFAEIADWLIEEFGAQILFIYGPGEEEPVNAVRQLMRNSPLPNYEPPTLGQTRALFEQVVLHVGNDNGPCHFAIAAGTPTVAIFGRPKAANWTPPNHPQHLAVEYDPGCKRSCVYPNCGIECVQAPTHEVKAAVTTLWNQLDRQA
jgi:ADP-heptose:LPS heptosyltransferase